MKKKLVLMRHGQTVFNQRKRIQGWVDSPLTPLGIEQAKFSAAYINGLDFTIDHAFSSTSERACDTLELVTNLPYERKKGLKEWNFGILDGEPEYLNPPLDQYDSFFKANGGESRENLISRMNATLTDRNHDAGISAECSCCFSWRGHPEFSAILAS
ncbi:histidine phosphatase family protein [Faecalibaculum rodentium]|uniref:histidine phosphatase family protein n=1 Tax=Faecalibaculum rodentium TaxID=1702221 RepID=UPI0023F18741|nr:histidine phosphatase family protein [Faecalibaculum rodentium]